MSDFEKRKFNNLIFVNKRLAKVFSACIFLLLLVVPFINLTFQADEELSPLSLYHRCYAQITQSRAPANDTLFTEINNGFVDPITACLEVLDKASLTTVGQTFRSEDSVLIADVADNEALNVINTFHRLHSSWFTNQTIPVVVNGFINRYTKDIFGDTASAAYFTKSLFHSDTEFKSIVTGYDTLRPIRGNDNANKGVISNQPKSNFIFSENGLFKLMAEGNLVGIATTGDLHMSYGDGVDRGVQDPGVINFGENLGGGMLGTQVFRLTNISQEQNFKSDGGVELPRKWASILFSDLLCRDLPLIRKSDAVPFVVANSTLPFRNSNSCTRCHVSMDQAAGVMRNFGYIRLGGGLMGDTNLGGDFAASYDVDTNIDGWPSEPDDAHYRSNPKGRLFYRNYNGVLIDIDVNNVAEIGDALAAQDDLYICTAKRYYEYFTGINIPMGDIGEDSYRNLLSDDDLDHRDYIIELGLALKQHQDPRQLIETILRSEGYKKTDFGLRSGP